MVTGQGEYVNMEYEQGRDRVRGEEKKGGLGEEGRVRGVRQMDC